MFNSTNNPLIFNWTPQNVCQSYTTTHSQHFTRRALISTHIDNLLTGIQLWKCFRCCTTKHWCWGQDSAVSLTALTFFTVLVEKGAPFSDRQVRRTWRQLTHMTWRIIHDTTMLVWSGEHNPGFLSDAPPSSKCLSRQSGQCQQWRETGCRELYRKRTSASALHWNNSISGTVFLLIAVDCYY